MTALIDVLTQYDINETDAPYLNQDIYVSVHIYWCWKYNEYSGEYQISAQRNEYFFPLTEPTGEQDYPSTLPTEDNGQFIIGVGGSWISSGRINTDNDSDWMGPLTFAEGVTYQISTWGNEFSGGSAMVGSLDTFLTLEIPQEI